MLGELGHLAAHLLRGAPLADTPQYQLQAVALSAFGLLAVLRPSTGPSTPQPSPRGRNTECPVDLERPVAGDLAGTPEGDREGALSPAQLWPVVLSTAYLLSLPWLAALGWTPWPPEVLSQRLSHSCPRSVCGHEPGQGARVAKQGVDSHPPSLPLSHSQRPPGMPPNGLASVGSLVSTPPTTALLVASLLHGGLLPARALVRIELSTTAHPAAAHVAKASLPLFWAAFGLTLMVSSLANCQPKHCLAHLLERGALRFTPHARP